VVVGFPLSLAVEAAEAEAERGCRYRRGGWTEELRAQERVEEAVVVNGDKAVQTRFYHGRNAHHPIQF